MKFPTSEEYSDSQRGIMIVTLGTGSILNKVISKAAAGSMASKEISTAEGKSGVVLEDSLIIYLRK